MAKESLFKEKISREEQLYRNASELQQAVPCILRFEAKAKALQVAAKKFERLGSYKDSCGRAVSCRKEAQKTIEQGSREVFALALEKEKQAKDKSSYADAITEFKRVWKEEAYQKEAKEHIQACQKQIARLETLATWKRRLTVIAVLAACAFLFIKSPLYPFAKGYAYQQIGQYKKALANYRQASAIPWTEELSGACYLKMAHKQLKQGNKKKARHLLKKAQQKGNKGAEKILKQLDKEPKGQKPPNQQNNYGHTGITIQKNPHKITIKGCSYYYSRLLHPHTWRSDSFRYPIKK